MPNLLHPEKGWNVWNLLPEEEDEGRVKLTFDNHLKELTSAFRGDNALRNQKDYLKNTPKPDMMSVKQWINRIKNINSYLPLMQPNGRSFTEEHLITEVISKNIPAAWIKDFIMFKLHLKTKIKDIISELTVTEEQVKTHPKPSQENPRKKQLKTPCRVHHGGHEWEDCRQNPKNQKTEDKKKYRNRNGNGNNNKSREEHRRTEGDGCSRSSTSSNDEFNWITDRANNEENKTIPSSEILVSIPEKKGSKKYITYLGLVNSGSSGLLINKNLIEYANFDIKYDWGSKKGHKKK
jgi:hypothetical protein